MKQLIYSLFTVFLLNFTLYSQTEITIIHVNDTHSQLDAVGPKDQSLNGTLGGIAKAASVIGLLKQTAPNPIFLHGGDACVGSLFYNTTFGVPELMILNDLGCDAMAVGNHEFDLGESTLADVLTTAFPSGGFPLLAANADVSGYPPLQPYIMPYIIKEFQGVKVGIFGMTIPDPLSNPGAVVISEDILSITSATVQALQAENVNVIIMLSHLGLNFDSQLAAGIPGINVVISSHDHAVTTQPLVVSNPAGFNTYICQAGRSYLNVGKLSITYNNGAVTMAGYELIPVDANVPAVPEIQALVSEIKADITQVYGNVFTNVLTTINKDVEAVPTNSSFKDSPLGNFITDAYRYSTNTEIGISANGLISDKLYKGAVVPADLFRTVAYGFDTTNGLNFRLVKFVMRGIELIKGLEYSLSYLGISDDFFMQISGVRFKYRPANPVGERVVLSSVRINEKIFDPARNYSFTVNEGLFGILLSMELEIDNIEFLALNEFTALCGYASQNLINLYSQGRIKELGPSESEIEENKSPENVKLFNNYPNPFNPVTTIEYLLESDSKVSLKVYNMLGQEIKALVNEYQKPGSYKIMFDASGLASGVYYYKLITNSFSGTKSMILVK